MDLPPQCNVGFCDRAKSANSQTCAKHAILTQAESDFDVVADPESGDDVYLYDGLWYTVEWRDTSALRGKFDGVFNAAASTHASLWFDLEDGNYILIPRLSLRSVWA